MIGNDIVDLELAREQSNWTRKGFLQKVFTPSERKILEASEDMEVCVWLLWSMKEAAYKAHQRKGSLPRRLNWTLQECISLVYNGSRVSGIVKVEGELYFSFSSITSERIHSIAVDHEETFYRENLFQLPGSRTKQFFKEQISKLLHIPFSELELEKTETGIPIISHKNKPFPLAFSFSDHGRFSGFCVSLRDS